MRKRYMNTFATALVIFAGCFDNKGGLPSKTSIEERRAIINQKASLEEKEIAQKAISEVVSRENGENIDKEALDAFCRRNGEDWIVLVMENTNKQGASWHMHISRSGEVSEFTGGHGI